MPRFEVVPHFTMFTSIDQPLWVDITSDYDTQIDVYVDGTTYITTIPVTKGWKRVKVWDTVPVGDGAHTVTFIDNNNKLSYNFTVGINNKVRIVANDAEGGYPISCVWSAVDMSNLTYMKDVGMYTELYLPMLQNSRLLVEVFKEDADGVYYYIGYVSNDTELYLQKVTGKVGVEYVFDLNAVKTVLKYVISSYFYIPDYLLDIPLRSAVYIVGWLQKLNLLPGNVYQYSVEDNTLKVIAEVKGGIAPAVISAVIFLVKLVAVTVSAYIIAEALSKLLFNVRAILLPNYVALENYEEIINDYKGLIEEVNKSGVTGPEKAKLISTVLQSMPTLGEVERAAAAQPPPSAQLTSLVPVFAAAAAVLLLLLLLREEKE